MGRLIVIDGLDGSGKQTQSELIRDALAARGRDVRLVHFPDYDDASSALVKMYLGGEFGSDPAAVNPYAASTFYAVDRFASYVRRWRDFYLGGGTVIADRYVTSNAIHQGGKLTGARRDEYLDWLFSFEYGKLELPRPDIVFLLDMPTAAADALLDGRYGGGEGHRDIHERDAAHLGSSHEAALYACARYGWTRIDCADAGGRVRDRRDIAREILDTFDRSGL